MEENNTKTEVSESKTYTQAEVDALLADGRKKTEKAVTEATKLAQMNDAERKEYELNERIKSLDERERQLALNENKQMASQILSEKGLSLEFVELVAGDNAEAINHKIGLLEKAFKESVKTEIEKRLAVGSKAPTVANSEIGMSREAFRKLSLAEQNKIYMTDRELYDSLTK